MTRMRNDYVPHLTVEQVTSYVYQLSTQVS